MATKRRTVKLTQGERLILDMITATGKERVLVSVTEFLQEIRTNELDPMYFTTLGRGERTVVVRMRYEGQG